MRSGQLAPLRRRVRRKTKVEFDTFFCYNSQDRQEVQDIGVFLRKTGIKPWLDEWELRPGIKWQTVLEKQIKTIASAVVFVGRAGIGPWQSLEIEAFLREFAERRCPIILVLLPKARRVPSDVPLFLRGFRWVDFRKSDPDPIAQLVWGITGERPDTVYSTEVGSVRQ